MKKIQIIAILVLVSLLAGCGYQLRGESKLPAELYQLRLINDGLNADQIWQLSDMLVKAGATLAGSDIDKPAQLKVALTPVAERNIADSAGSGKTVVQIAKKLSYSIQKPDDAALSKTKVIERQINIEQDSNNLLGTEAEKQAAEKTLDQTLFNQLIFQLKRI